MALRKIASIPVALAVLLALAVGLIGMAKSATADNGGRPFSTSLTGEAEVTIAGVPNQGDLDGTGTAMITLNPGQGQVCWEIEVSGITLPAAAAHIHVGASTTTGPVVVGLSAPDANGVSMGCALASRDLIKAIIQNPADYYVNVHTSDFPAGALRGQLGK
jgi:hypothetical protein